MAPRADNGDRAVSCPYPHRPQEESRRARRDRQADRRRRRPRRARRRPRYRGRPPAAAPPPGRRPDRRRRAPREHAGDDRPRRRRRRGAPRAPPGVGARRLLPDELPISGRVDDIRAALETHQVVVVAGETGSGKTTQLPKMALELGRGVLGTIGHTQPRRIAARTVAERVAEELGTTGTDTVGYQVRFTSRASEDTLVKLMTDGILLAEIQQDRMLRRYDTLIIDEAHERSLNIDFLLGYLAQLLPAPPRPQGHHHLGDDRPGAVLAPLRRRADHRGLRPHLPRRGPLPAVGRPGRSRRATSATRSTASSTRSTSCAARAPGGRRARLPLRRAGDPRRRRRPAASTREDLDVLPLYARLSSAEQHRVFEPSSGGRRRVVLATNVAETSLTVPGIRYVVDPGLARISRYSPADQGAAPADRADLAGVGHPAGRALRARRRRHLHPALRRGRLRRAARSSPTRRSSARTSPR